MDDNIRLTVMAPDLKTELELPLSSSGVSAGFPSPADDHLEGTLDLNKAFIRHKASTFFVRVDGESMKDDCIDDQDLLIVDRAIEPYSGCVAVCFVDGEFTLKRLNIKGDEIKLMPANDKYKPIVISKDDDFTIWGVVTYSIKKH